MPDFLIKEASEEDFHAIHEMIREFSQFQKMPEKMVNTVDKMMEDKNFFHCLVAETGDGIIFGYATFYFAYYTWTGKAVYLDDLYVRKEFRGLGAGKKLLEGVFDFARENGCTKVRWQVSKWNKNAIGFYQSIGATVDDIELNCDLKL